MKAIIKHEMKTYLKSPLYWIGVVIVIYGMYQILSPYFNIHYVSSEQEIQAYADVNAADADIHVGYVPSTEAQRRELWNEILQKSLVSDFGMEISEADTVMQELQNMNVNEASLYLEENYGYCGAQTLYEMATRYHKGTMEEINTFLASKLENHSFSYYFARKFADFAGVYMAFFATILLAFLFIQDTRKNTYELLHTKPVSAGGYVCGKVMGGFFICLIALLILNVIFFCACIIYTKGTGFVIRPWDFLIDTCVYILPNMLMIVCVYALIAILFQNPLPGVPLLFLYIIYSNMGSRNADGIYGYYGRPLAIMVRFPGAFFDTAPPPMVLLNQSFLVVASILLICITIAIWKRRRI